MRCLHFALAVEFCGKFDKVTRLTQGSFLNIEVVSRENGNYILTLGKRKDDLSASTHDVDAMNSFSKDM